MTETPSGKNTENRRNEKYERLTQLLADVCVLQQVGQIVMWDQHTQMPSAGAGARAHHLAVVSKVSHEKLTDPEIGRLLEELRDYEESLPYESDEASTIRVARREYERATKLPPDLIVRLSRARSDAHEAWLRAREAKDYKVFRPALGTMVGLMEEVAETLGYKEHPIDALLDYTEPGVTVADLERLFGELREHLVPLVKAVSEKLDAVDDSCLHQHFDRDKQVAAAEEAVRAIGFDLDERGRMDFSVHPFTTSFSANDVRITTRVDENYLSACFFACLHEAGHGTYMQGLPARLDQSILQDGASSGLHESQSRLWENIVGRSRAFWEFFYPRLVRYFPDQLAKVSVEEFYRAVNKVEPSLVRVEADEVTYNLHIMIRFELEKAVFDGKLDLRDMPSAWNAKFEEYLGLTPPDDLVGCLQDIHWTFGFGAGFPGYTIGNVASVQLYEEALKEHPDLPDQFARGEFADLLGWMNRNVHAHGRRFEPQELLERITGRPLEAGPYLAYIKRKFSDIYGL
jgi:carboxypeptidase Taq